MHLRTPSHFRKAVAQLHRLEGVRSLAATTRRYTLLAAVHNFELRRHGAPAERKGKPNAPRAPRRLQHAAQRYLAARLRRLNNQNVTVVLTPMIASSPTT